MRHNYSLGAGGLLICALSCGESREPQEWEDPTAWDKEVDDPELASTLFHEQVLSPLMEWRFDPSSERYLAAYLNEGGDSVVWRVDLYEITDLSWEVARGRWNQFEAVVTFRSQGHLVGLDETLVHDHKHVYRLSRRSWNLKMQSYLEEGRSCGCLVGHSNCDVWMAEAICVDESNRFRSLED